METSFPNLDLFSAAWIAETVDTIGDQLVTMSLTRWGVH